MITDNQTGFLFVEKVFLSKKASVNAHESQYDQRIKSTDFNNNLSSENRVDYKNWVKQRRRDKKARQ